MPKCNSALQTEKDLNPKFDQICPKIATYRPFFGLQNPQKLLGIPQLMSERISIIQN